MNTVDATIVAVYAKFNVPADQIVLDPTLSKKFGESVNAALPDDQHVTIVQINKRMISLRKKGSDNGGLPRIRREYFGRN